MDKIYLYIARIHKDRCIGCGICEDKCSSKAVQVVDDKALVNEALCIGCGICVDICPQDIIHLEITDVAPSPGGNVP